MLSLKQIYNKCSICPPPTLMLVWGRILKAHHKLNFLSQEPTCNGSRGRLSVVCSAYTFENGKSVIDCHGELAFSCRYKVESLSFNVSKTKEFRTFCHSRKNTYFVFYILVKFVPVFLKHTVYFVYVYNIVNSNYRFN